MTSNEFLKIKLTATKPKFKDLVGLKESDKTSVLIDFMHYLHNGNSTSRIAQGSKGTVYGKKTYHFTIYTTCILRTEQESGIRTMYKL